MRIEVNHKSLLNLDEDTIKCLSVEGGTMFDDFILVPLGGGLVGRLGTDSRECVCYMEVSIYDVRIGKICEDKILLYRGEVPDAISGNKKDFVLGFETNVKLVAKYLELHQKVAKNAGAGNAGHAT